MNFCKNFKITKVKAGAASAGTAVESDVVDMQGYEGVIFVTTIATANAGNYLKAQQGAIEALSDAVDLAATTVVATANAETVWLEVHKPSDRYVRAVVIRAGANTATGDIFAIRYNGRVKPETNVTTDTITGTLLISPAELAIS